MWPERDYQQALHLIKAGINDSEIGRRLGIPRGTVRDWRVGMEVGSGGRTKDWTGRRTVAGCFRCDDGWVDEEAYAYLLGVYLGDGCLAIHPRQVYRLRIFCDLKYTEIIDEVTNTIIVIRGNETVTFTAKRGCVEVSAYWKHWLCLFPQHGPGRKHERKIQLTSWQRSIIATHPKALIRGLIQSDGTRHINEVAMAISSGPKRYRYPRYMFSNRSSDILGIFTDALDLLVIHWTQTTPRDISIARRADVEFLDTFVGPKR